MRVKNLRIKITRPGWSFIWLSIGVGMSALNTGNNLLYLVFGMMLSFLILSGLLSNNSLMKLRIHATFPRRIFARQAVPVRMNLENGKRMVPSYAITLRPQTDTLGHRGGVFVVKIPSQSSVSATDHIRFPRRGWVSLPPYYAETAYPFGLIRKAFVTPSVGRTVVYPALLEIEPWLGRQQQLQGEYLSGDKGGFNNPYGIRDYVAGDPARLIHWKSSAKFQKWRVKEFESEKKLRILLDVILAPTDQSEEAYTDRALSAASSLIFYLSKKGIEITLRLNGELIKPEGRGYLDAYLTSLALAQAPPSRIHTSAYNETNYVISVSDLPAPSLSGDLVLGRGELEDI